MTNDFCEGLLGRLNPEERIFKFKSAEIVRNTLNVSLMVRAETYDKVLDDHLRKKVNEVAADMLPNDVKVNINFVKTFADEKTVKNAIIEYMYNEHKTVYPVFCNANYKIDINGDYGEVIVTLEKYVYTYAKGIDLATKIVEYLDTVLIENFEVDFLEIPNSETSEIPDAIIHNEGGIRLIDAKPTVYYVKGGVINYPRYIKDIVEQDKEVTNTNVCGVVSDVKSRNIILKNPRPNGAKEIELYTFILNDTTAQLRVKYFARYNAKFKWEEVIVDGTNLIMNGDMRYDSYDNKICFNPRSIASAEINFESINIKSNFNKDYGQYMRVIPEPFSSVSQDDLFDVCAATDENDKMFDGTTYCVFDLETTGLSTESDEIIELSAIKIVDGKFTDKFSTFVKPSIEIPSRVVELTGITKEMVEDAPLPRDVIPDFFRFTRGATLVGHNIASFDIPLLNSQAFKVKYEFDNPYIDTMILARQKLHISRYNLGSVCEHLNVPLIGAHRAINDVAANAKAFLKLMKL